MNIMKRIFIIHRWYGSPEADWYPWLKKELEKKGFVIIIPNMPMPEAPDIKSWTDALRKAVGIPDKETYFIGHSIGCQTILRYLESLSSDVKIGGALFVAGWFMLTSESTPTEKEIEITKPWLAQKIQFEKVQEHVDKMTAILSDDDPYVSLIENKREFERLGAKVIVEHDKGHYDEDSKTFELPIAIKAFLELVGKE